MRPREPTAFSGSDHRSVVQPRRSGDSDAEKESATEPGPTVESVAASDAFFPFRDGLDILADAGVRAVIQPGGSVRDADVIAAAEERGLAMVFTGERHFRH